MKNGYSICFNEWALDKDIKNELGLLLIISSLCAQEGYCFASNEYFAKLFDTPEETISRKIKKLEELNYLTIIYEKRGAEIKKREIRLTKISIDDKQKCQSTINKNVKDNIISINNISINNNNKFKKPSVEEINSYCIERKNNINADAFFDYYESKGWLIGKSKMKDWKAAIRTWERNNRKEEKEEVKSPYRYIE